VEVGDPEHPTYAAYFRTACLALARHQDITAAFQRIGIVWPAITSQ